MTTFATGNPVGSAAPKDLFDNAQNLDLLMLGEAQYYPDRLGVGRLSWSGIEEQFSNFLVNSGYEVPVPYASGITVTRPTQTFSYQGEIYRPKVAAIPFTTTTFAADSDRLLAMGDAVLRGQLASNSQGASLIARNITVVNSVAQARQLSRLSPSQFVMTTGYYAAGDGGSAWYRFNQSDATTVDDGAGTLVTADGGRLSILIAPVLNAKQCGARGDNSTVDRLRIQAGLDYCQAKRLKSFEINDGTFIVEQSVLIPPNITVKGNGTIKAAQSGFNGVIQAPFSGAGAAFTRPLFRNKGFFSSSISDENITVEGLTFDYGTVVLAGGGAHCINIRRARTVRVINCTFNNGEDGVGLLGCDDTLIEGCTARNFTNCAYDHWDSPKDARVINCYAGTSNSVQIVNFNPEPTAQEAAGGYIADSFTMSGCVFEYNGASGSFCQLEPLVDGNAARHITVVGNVFRNISLAIRRNTSNVTVTGNVFDGSVPTNPNSAIMCNPTGSDTPTSVAIIGNHFKDWRTISSNLAVILMMCNGYTVTGNTVTGASFYASLYVGDYQGRQTGNLFSVGTSGQAVLGGGAVPTWTGVTTINGWVESGTAGELPPAYKVFDDQRRVCLRGSIRSGGIGQVAFTIPPQFAPQGVTRFAVVSNGAFGAVLVNSDGTVMPFIGSNAQLSVDGIEWSY